MLVIFWFALAGTGDIYYIYLWINEMPTPHHRNDFDFQAHALLSYSDRLGIYVGCQPPNGQFELIYTNIIYLMPASARVHQYGSEIATQLTPA